MYVCNAQLQNKAFIGIDKFNSFVNSFPKSHVEISTSATLAYNNNSRNKYVKYSNMNVYRMKVYMKLYKC